MSLIQLQCLKRLAAGRTRARDLSTSLGVTPAAVTKIIDKLFERGLLSRTRSLLDRRSAALEITAAGKAALERSRRTRSRALRTLLDPLSDEEVSVLTRVIRRSVDALPAVWEG